MELKENILGQLHIYCESVSMDCKPMAFFPIQERYVEEIKNYVFSRKLNIHIEPLSDGWFTIYIYKYDYLIHIIENLPQKPQTPYDHWVIGKACGYSDLAIGEFIQSKFN